MLYAASLGKLSIEEVYDNEYKEYYLDTSFVEDRNTSKWL